MFLMSAGYMSFIAKITDKKYAAVYITVIQTVRSIGFFWPMYLSMATVDLLTFYKPDCEVEVSKVRNLILCREVVH